MFRSTPHEGFALAFHDSLPDAAPHTRTVLLLHGWPGDSSDYRAVVPLLDPAWRVVVPDLRGFGGSDRHLRDPDECYGAHAQAGALLALLDELGVDRVVVGAYDIGSRIAQQLARSHPDRVQALVLAPPLPGGGRRILEPDVVAETWYVPLHRSPLAVALLDGNPTAVETYLRHFWDRWSAPGFPTDTPELAELVARYARPGAFEASISFYRTGAGYVTDTATATAPAREDRLTTPTHVVWPDLDPIYSRTWADALPQYFTDVTVHPVDGVGHFVPLEAPAAFAAALRIAADGLDD